MATRSHTTFKKRQKEMARMEKQRDKAAQRTQRKLTTSNEPRDPNAAGDFAIVDEFGNVEDLPVTDISSIHIAAAIRAGAYSRDDKE